MPRPGGNPLLKQYQMKSTRPIPLREKMTLRVTEEMMQELKSLDEDWHDFVRESIAKSLKEKNQQTAQETSSNTGGSK